jgi:urease accessory protein
MLHSLTRVLIPATVLLLPSIAGAHDGLPHVSFADGLLHPFAGLDHALAALAVGLLAGRLQTRQAWLVPLAFMTAMIVGALLSLSGIAVPVTEFMVALSLVAVGFSVAAPHALGLAGAAVLVGFFALFHGYAHGLEARGGTFAHYIVGLALSTGLLHALGVSTALALRRGALPREPTLRLLGRLVMIAGVVIVVRLV